MLFWLIPLIVLAVSALVALVVVLRHVPQLSVLDVDTIKEERTKRLKDRIILERFGRLHAKQFAWLRKLGTEAVSAVSKAGRRSVQRLYKLEQYYQRLKQVPGTTSAADPNAIKRSLDQAEEFVRDDEMVQAEKIYIEIISHNPKNVDAYEGLGNLYMKNHQHEQARETLRFALRLDADNASVLMSLGQLETAQDNHKEALDALRKAIAIRPKNPKYLDAYVEAALAGKSPADAEKGIGLLKEVNPDNQKIADFEARALSLHKPPAA